MNNRLLELMTKDQKVLKKIIKSKNKTYALTVAQEKISDYTAENFKKDIEELEKIMRGNDHLDKDQLDSVTGGVGFSAQQIGLFSEKYDVDFGKLLKSWISQ
ncbi:MAG: hypothetical protein LBL38_00620 [Lactobacillales bacterium]|jgi:peptide deformylase|nr:hypothetical protein [Lactobacillales bacterium]